MSTAMADGPLLPQVKKFNSISHFLRNTSWLLNSASSSQLAFAKIQEKVNCDFMRRKRQNSCSLYNYSKSQDTVSYVLYTCTMYTTYVHCIYVTVNCDFEL